MKRILCLLLVTCFCGAQTQYRTRTVILFGDLERRISIGTDRATLLTDDFEERRCASPGTPIPRDAWLAAPAPKFSFTQEAVHDYGAIAIYSALGSDSESQFMVVDTWQKQGDSWKLAVRYSCPATGVKEADTIPNRY